MTIQLNLWGNIAAKGTEATDFHANSNSISGRMELYQGVHQALLRSLAQPRAAGGMQLQEPDVSGGR